MNKVLYLSVGSVLGGLLRYYFGGFVQRAFDSTFPYGTLAVNLSGCFLMGLFSAYANGRLALDSPSRLLFMVGFCGAFTTLSAFMFEADSLIKSGQVFGAFLNLFLTVVAGFFLFRIGVGLGEVLSH